MTQIVTALFENYDDAYEAVRRIEAAGISYRDISIVSNARGKRHIVQLGTTDDASKGASTGLGIGAALGGGAGLLAGLVDPVSMQRRRDSRNRTRVARRVVCGPLGCLECVQGHFGKRQV